MESIRTICLTLMVVFIVVSLGTCTAYQSKIQSDVVVSMVQAGADPLRARCAMRSIGSVGSEFDTMCQILASQK